MSNATDNARTRAKMVTRLISLEGYCDESEEMAMEFGMERLDAKLALEKFDSQNPTAKDEFLTALRANGNDARNFSA